MSIFTAPLSHFEIEIHPNADALSIVKIGGWQCVVRTEAFKDETLAIYVPLDAIATEDHPLFSFLKGQRVKTCKLRGVLSQGVAIPYGQALQYMKETLGMGDLSIEKVSVIGKDFTSILGIKRWFDETPIGTSGGLAEASHPDFQKYSSVENIKNFLSVISFGEEVHITEKLHGTSARYALVDSAIMLGTRGRQLVKDVAKKSVWHTVFENENLEETLVEFSRLMGNTKVGIYGEIVGPKIQDLKYGQLTPKFFAYDLLVDGRFLDPITFKKVAAELKLVVCPELKVGPFTEQDLEMRLGKSTLDASHLREGVVIKPLVPRWNEEIGRVILKVISEEYLMRNGAKDSRDE